MSSISRKVSGRIREFCLDIAVATLRYVHSFSIVQIEHSKRIAYDYCILQETQLFLPLAIHCMICTLLSTGADKTYDLKRPFRKTHCQRIHEYLSW